MRTGIPAAAAIFHPSTISFRGPRRQNGHHCKSYTALAQLKSSENGANTGPSYSGAPEILQYFKDVAEKYDLNKYVRLNHTVVGAHWNESEQLWHVLVQDGDDPNAIFLDKANVFINASGVLKCVHPSPQPSLSHPRKKQR